MRASTFGQRGRAKFARALEVSPSTYNYYERGRTPPMPILLRMSEVAGVDLRWLLTGRFPSGGLQPATGPGEPLAPEHAKILTRLGAVLPRRAEAAAALNALLDLLESQPTSPWRATGSKPPLRRGGRGGRSPEELGVPPAASPPSLTRIPVLGRTAAGVPHFWKESQRRSAAGKSVDLLRSAVARGAEPIQTRPATLTPPEGTSPADSSVLEHAFLVQLARPVRVGGLHIAEFLDCPGAGQRWPDAFALRIDGDSMHPSLSHGDLVIQSPREAARPGHPAVVQLRNQIGVTCKLFYTDKSHVHLIPVNEQFTPTKYPLKDLVWALAVLYRVRFSPSG